LAGNLRSIDSSNANGVSIDYDYDALNRLAKVTDNRLSPPGETTYAYDNVGNLDHYLYPNGVKHQYTYNTLNRLTNLTVSKVTTLTSYTYDLGPAGNRTAVTEHSGRKASYTYDDLYRLTQEKIENDPASINGTIGYDYDPVGNRLSRTSTVPGIANQTFTYDANDRLNTDTYDDNGNTTGSDGNTYDYDFENHLTEQNGGNVTIVYDGDGNRVSKTVGGVTTEYLVDDRNLTGYAQVVDEIINGTVDRVYTYGLDLISQQQSSGVSFYGYDGHGSVRFLTDANGAVTDTYDYDAFGNLIHSTGSTPNNYLYTGEQLDPNVGFYYLRARYLNVRTGRFWTMDGFEGSRFEPLSLHKYLYANINPIDNVDLSGTFTLIDILVTLANIGRWTARQAVRGFTVLKTVFRFLYDNRTFRAISRRYWRLNGPASGNSLHHWLLPQRWTWIPQGLRNAGFNLLNLPAVINFPGGLNSYLGFALNWGGYRMVVAVLIENGIRIVVPLAIYGSWNFGQSIGQQIVNSGSSSQPTTLTSDEEAELESYRRDIRESAGVW